MPVAQVAAPSLPRTEMGAGGILDLAALRHADVVFEPYPHFVVENFVRRDHLTPILEDFPTDLRGGSYPLDQVHHGEALGALFEALGSGELRELVSRKFQIDLGDAPVTTTLRGHSRTKDGKVHTDSKSKLVTLLLYLNEPGDMEAGHLRLLRSSDVEDFFCEIAPCAGTLAGFRVTENCWHGYRPYEGPRRSVQLNYVTNAAAADRHLWRHRLSARVKRLIRAA